MAPSGLEEKMERFMAEYQQRQERLEEKMEVRILLFNIFGQALLLCQFELS